MQSQNIICPELFNFKKTVEHLMNYRQRSGADLLVENTYQRVINYRGTLLPVLVKESPQPNEITISIPDQYEKSDLGYASVKIAKILGFEADLEGFYKSVETDCPIAKITQTFHGLRPSLSDTMFEALVIAIIGQQISASVARIIRDLIVDTFGDEVSAFSKTLKSFPRPEAILSASHEQLRAAKLSSRKVQYLQGIALMFSEGIINEDKFLLMDDEPAIEHLIKGRGIGRWTAQWILIRALGRQDICPAGDLVLKKTISELYNIRTPLSDLDCEIFMKRKWAPYRSLATTYLFANLRTERAFIARSKGIKN